MRREDRQCNKMEFIEAVLDRAEVIFVAMSDGDYPYCIPVNFVRVGKCLYIHSALEGHKLHCITADEKVAFSTAIDISIDTARATTYYKSICGRGRAVVISDEAEKGRALDALAERYQARCARPAPLASIRRVAIIRIDMEDVTGKGCLS